MRILMINKFLFPNGGSETYIFKLGKYLGSKGHEVQYFGMEHEGRCVGNRVNAYTTDMDFHGGSKLSKLMYPVKTIYSFEARKKLRLVLEDFQPDVCHLNNFQYQLTPSIILEIVKWRKEAGRKCRIVYTAHDYNLVCPNHMLHNPNTHENCTRCLGGHYWNCVRGRCIHGSLVKSLVGAVEGYFWKWKKVYKYIDTVICCADFLKTKLDTDSLLAGKTIAMHNFVDAVEPEKVDKKNYVLYFGRFSEEKGIHTLAEACKKLSDIPFIFAGSGLLEDKVNALPNVRNVGFQSGEVLEKLIREARFSVCPSEIYDNCPFAVLESQQRGTPVVGAEIGGIPELILDGKNGRLFQSGDANSLAEVIRELWDSPKIIDEYAAECLALERDSVEKYEEKIVQIYSGGGITLLVYAKRNADYVLYFGRFAEEKGIGTLLETCRKLPCINFIFAGSGPLEGMIDGLDNVKNVGFRTGEFLEELIRKARFTVYPSEWYENCPFSVVESQMYGTPVLGADIGGIPELLEDGRTGELFESGNAEDLKEKISKLWENRTLIERYRDNCRETNFDTVEEYYRKLIKIYEST